MASQSRPPVVLVEWLDASAENEQMNVKVGIERMQLDRRYSLGFLVHKDRTRVVLASTFDPAGSETDLDQADCWLVVPRGWIESITTMVPAAQQPEKETE